MSPRSLERALFGTIALLVGVYVLARATRDVFWSDFYTDAWPSYVALHQGDLGGFFDSAPDYAGFLSLIGAPLTFAAAALGFDDLRLSPTRDLEEIYIATAIPGVAATAWLAAALAEVARARGAQLWHALLVVVVAAPVAYLALQFGHPEIVLAASAAVGAVLVARSGRIAPAVLLVMLAALCDSWMLLAIPAVALAAPRANVKLGLASAAACAVAVLGLQLVTGTPSGDMFTSAGAVFHGHQWLYPLGVEPAAGVRLPSGDATRLAPGWLAASIHPLIAVVAVALSTLWWARSGRRDRNRDDALALLALVFLARCALDPWNIHYVHLPMLLALVAWEASRGRAPVLSLASSTAVWISFVTYKVHYGTGPFLVYLAWSLPLAALLGYQLFVAGHVTERAGKAARAGRVGVSGLPAADH